MGPTLSTHLKINNAKQTIQTGTSCKKIDIWQSNAEKVPDINKQWTNAKKMWELGGRGIERCVFKHL